MNTITIGDAIKTLKTVAEYNALLDRARKILDGPPYLDSCDSAGPNDSELMRLNIKNDIATLQWMVGGYETDYPRSEDFPATLLTLSDDELDIWKANEKRLDDEQRTQREAQRQQDVEAAERVTYARLKAKFGD
jgi:hypothetical protein